MLPSFFGEKKSGLSERQGYGTYVTPISLPPEATTRSLVLSLTPSDTAGRYVVTDLAGQALSPVVEQGKVGVELDASLPQRVPSEVPLRYGLPETILVWVQVSNFHQEIGGIWGAPKLVEATYAFRSAKVQSMIDGLLVGLMVLFGIYHMVIYLQGRRDPILLSFSLLCFLVGVRTAVMARYPELFIGAWTVDDYSVWLKVEFLTLPLCVLAFGYYFKAFSLLFMQPLWVWRSITSSGWLLVALIIVTPTTFSTSLLGVLQAHMVAGVFWLAFRLFTAWQARVPYIDLVLLGGLALALTITQDTLHARQIINTGHFAHYVFGVFLFVQSMIISRRYSETVDERDDLTQRVMKQAALLAHESDQRTVAEIAQRDAERALRVQAEAKMTLFGEAVHHINNPLNHILGSLHGLASRQSEVRQLTNNLFPDDEELSNDAREVKEKYSEHFEDALGFYESATNAIERAASTIQLLRALSGVDGIAYKSIYFGDIWEIIASRSMMLTQLISPKCIDDLVSQRCVGHPAMYAQALELIIGSFTVPEDQIGMIRRVGDDAVAPLRMKASRQEQEPQEMLGTFFDLEVGFSSGVEAQDADRTVEIVQYLLEPYGSQVSFDGQSYRLSVLTKLG